MGANSTGDEEEGGGVGTGNLSVKVGEYKLDVDVVALVIVDDERSIFFFLYSEGSESGI